MCRQMYRFSQFSLKLPVITPLIPDLARDRFEKFHIKIFMQRGLSLS